MKFLPGLSLAAASIFPLKGHQTEAERIKLLKEYFRPRAGDQVSISARDLSSSVSMKDYYTLRGYIVVTPPPGVCLTIRTSENRNDHRVCKKTAVSFQLKDIDATGKINWDVSTGEGDFGTNLWWQTPYLVGKYVDDSMPWPGPSRVFFMAGCRNTSRDSRTKTMELTILPGKKIIIKLPLKEVLAPQPDREKPNLYIQQSTFASGFVRMDKAKNANGEDVDPNTIVTDWQIHPRNSYILSGSQVLTGENGPGRGKCRYRYTGYDYHKDFPVLECHGIGGFQWLYVPLTCLNR